MTESTSFRPLAVTFDRPAPAVVASAALPTATLHEAQGRRGALPGAIKPIDPSMRLCGPAFPVRCPPGDNLRIHHAIYAARPGDVLVVDCSGRREHGYWGEIMNVAAIERRLGGLVIDGGVRDRDRLVELGWPVFAHGICIRGTGKDPTAPGSLGEPITIGDVDIAPGDLVVGDADGVVVVPRAQVASIVDAAREREAREATILRRLREGATTLEIYGFDPAALG
jgi:4-hydroxy-4-methyl-2-oxoglutarate aldolase